MLFHLDINPSNIRLCMDNVPTKGCLIPIQSQLAAVGVDGHIGKAGYYFMPDFEVIRPMLAAR